MYVKEKFTFFVWYEEDVLIITSGLVYENQTHTETEVHKNIENLEKRITWRFLDFMNHYPLDVWGATGGLLMEKYIFFCGGIQNKQPSKNCHSISGNFHKKLSMLEPRAFAASIVFNSVWILIKLTFFLKKINIGTNFEV